jgi:hypothetical protein
MAWKMGVMTSILMSLIVVFGAIALIGCCVIPCLWVLTARHMETALIKQLPVSYQLLLSTAEKKNQIFFK